MLFKFYLVLKIISIVVPYSIESSFFSIDETFIVAPLEQSLLLEISPSSTLTVWLVIDNDGDTLAQGEVPASGDKTIISICLNSDSYSFVIYSDEACNTCHYELSNIATSSIVSESYYSQ